MLQRPCRHAASAAFNGACVLSSNRSITGWPTRPLASTKPNSSSQAANGAGSILWQNNAGSNVAFINWDGGYATGDGTNYKISLDTETVSLSSDALMVWHNVNSVFS